MAILERYDTGESLFAACLSVLCLRVKSGGALHAAIDNVLLNRPDNSVLVISAGGNVGKQILGCRSRRLEGRRNRNLFLGFFHEKAVLPLLPPLGGGGAFSGGGPHGCGQSVAP